MSEANNLLFDRDAHHLEAASPKQWTRADEAAGRVVILEVGSVDLVEGVVQG